MLLTVGAYGFVLLVGTNVKTWHVREPKQVWHTPVCVEARTIQAAIFHILHFKVSISDLE